MVFEQEAAFETALINLLTEKYGWEPEILRYKTEEELIQNWKQILFENNRDVDRLNDVPLTDGEMQQILDQITRLRTPSWTARPRRSFQDQRSLPASALTCRMRRSLQWRCATAASRCRRAYIRMSSSLPPSLI